MTVLNPNTIITIIGLFITLYMIARNVKGAIFIGMIVTAIIGYFTDLLQLSGVASLPPAPVFFDLDIAGVSSNGLYTGVLPFFFATIFDIRGALTGVSGQAGCLEDGKSKRAIYTYISAAVARTASSRRFQ